mmetsp:Transcript_10073/g.14966  ORF Transcript_10073/g.14966 Transcript_10073/m.14966 type:complete len:185 (+) Transcript_10073:36-590(+)|eukprot:15327683-Ditylum_brightwellii.AAC.1
MKFFFPLLLTFATLSVNAAFSIKKGPVSGGGGGGLASPNLVNKDKFVAAITVLEQEIAKENGEEPPPPLDESKFFFGMARTEATLTVEQIKMGLYLVEAGELTLVNGVSQDVYDAGVAPRDTIVSVAIDGGSDGVGRFDEQTKEMDIEGTANVIRGAIQYATEQKVDAVLFELNRLMKMGYADQ